MPSSQRTASFLYLLSPREFILMAGSLPRFPQRFIVRGETLKTSATSLTVSKSGKLSKDSLFFTLGLVETLAVFTLSESGESLFFLILKFNL